MMNWEQLLSTKRFGLESYHEPRKDSRTEFQRDYDRLIFSPPFRRLQNKTQVFPLPGSIFVHNRLTHSLEVSSVGRSLGINIARCLADCHPNCPIIHEIDAIVAAACLAHDMGNPPFGHSGEKAIATFFSEGEGQKLAEKMSPVEWKDLVCFEGNANTFRLLTHQFAGRRKGGFVLTYNTLASIVKYPYASAYTNSQHSKFGFFNSEADDFKKIADELGIINVESNSFHYVRYPLVFLIEAADDICYQLMDIEDAHKLKILSTEETKFLFLNYFDENQKRQKMEVLNLVNDENEQIAYLRSSVIGKLVEECSQIFVDNEENILNGTFHTSLIEQLPPLSARAYQYCSDVANSKIYCSKQVLEVELSGYKIILTLLENLIHAVLQPQKAYSQQLLMRIPSQYEINHPTMYGKIMAVLDYISGMTDVYALDFYKKINGIDLPTL